MSPVNAQRRLLWQHATVCERIDPYLEAEVKARKRALARFHPEHQPVHRVTFQWEK